MLISGCKTGRLGATLALVAAVVGMQASAMCAQAAAKVGHFSFRSLVAESDCIVVARIVALGKEKEREYAVIQPVEQIKGHVGKSARFVIGFGEGRVFTLKPGSIAVFCLKAEKTKNQYHDAGAGRGTLPILSTAEAKVVEVDTGTLTNVPMKKVNREQVGVRWEGWREYYSFYACDPFLSALKTIAAKKTARRSSPQ